jgi:hypothetical protein
MFWNLDGDAQCVSVLRHGFGVLAPTQVSRSAVDPPLTIACLDVADPRLDLVEGGALEGKALLRLSGNCVRPSRHTRKLSAR